MAQFLLLSVISLNQLQRLVGTDSGMIQGLTPSSPLWSSVFPPGPQGSRGPSVPRAPLNLCPIFFQFALSPHTAPSSVSHVLCSCSSIQLLGKGHGWAYGQVMSESIWGKGSHPLTSTPLFIWGEEKNSGLSA